MKRIGLILAALLAIVSFAWLARRTIRISPAGAEETTPDKPMAALDFTLKDLNGQDVSLSQFRGKIVLVNFWATWCEPCKIETPWLVELQDKYARRGFTVLGIAMDGKDKNAVSPFVQEARFEINGSPRYITYPIVVGNDATADEFGGVEVLPTSFLISKDGREVKRVDGLVSYDEIDRDIQSQLRPNESFAR